MIRVNAGNDATIEKNGLHCPQSALIDSINRFANAYKDRFGGDDAYKNKLVADIGRELAEISGVQEARSPG